MAQPRKNYDEAVNLYEKGLSAPKIAKIFGIASSGIYEILKRRGCKIRNQGNSICSVDECGEPMKARGFCSRHSAQFYAHGKIISAEKIHDPNRKCIVLGCGRKHKAKGYCVGHFGQFKKYGAIVYEILAPRGTGITSGGGGYLLIKKPWHPYANKRGYVKRCNLVWEENTSHVVIPPECIHHKNGNILDDSFENLQLFANDAHHQSAKHRMKGHFGAVPGGWIL